MEVPIIKPNVHGYFLTITGEVDGITTPQEETNEQDLSRNDTTPQQDTDPPIHSRHQLVTWDRSTMINNGEIPEGNLDARHGECEPLIGKGTISIQQTHSNQHSDSKVCNL